MFSSNLTRSFVEAAGHTSGTLTLANGTKQAQLGFLGSYATSNLTLTSDPGGGTLVGFF